jgi:hypothetical protein
VLDLRERLAWVPLPQAARLQLEGDVLPGLARLFEHPDEAAHRHALQSLGAAERAIADGLAASPPNQATATRRLLAELHLLRAQLEDAALSMLMVE